MFPTANKSGFYILRCRAKISTFNLFVTPTLFSRHLLDDLFALLNRRPRHDLNVFVRNEIDVHSLNCMYECRTKQAFTWWLVSICPVLSHHPRDDLCVRAPYLASVHMMTCAYENHTKQSYTQWLVSTSAVLRRHPRDDLCVRVAY